MNLKKAPFAAALTAALTLGGTAQADTELVVVSWGGAYTKSQQLAYHGPFMKNNPGGKILNDDSASEAVAKLRAMAEANNWSWDLVDMVASDAITACDEGIILPVKHDELLAPAPDGTPGRRERDVRLARRPRPRPPPLGRRPRGQHVRRRRRKG